MQIIFPFKGLQLRHQQYIVEIPKETLQVVTRDQDRCIGVRCISTENSALLRYFNPEYAAFGQHSGELNRLMRLIFSKMASLSHFQPEGLAFISDLTLINLMERPFFNLPEESATILIESSKITSHLNG
jgi:hypothetical protein